MAEPEKSTLVEKLIDEPWRMQQDYKRLIITLETQNEKYRNELYELGETVNKILDKTKIRKDNTPNLESQLQVVKKELENANKFIEIYKKQLKSVQKGESASNQLLTIAQSEQTLKLKQKQLNDLKKQVRQLTNKNKALQYRIMEYNRKGKAKSIDTAALMLKQALYENKQLKTKIQQLEEMEKKKSAWLKKNVQSTKDLKTEISKLPSIQRRSADRLSSSLPKLQQEKKIYTKWIENYKTKGHEKAEKQIEDLEKINKMVGEKITVTTTQINDIKSQIQKIKQKITPSELQKIKQAAKKQEEKGKSKKDWGGNATVKVRRSRRDWVGKFDGLRFSDSRVVREEARLFKIIYNSNGWYQFYYYSVADKQKIFSPVLPFDINIFPKGKQSTFTVEHPDFIKEFKLKINLKSFKIVQIDLTSNLGITAEFQSEEEKPPSTAKPKKGGKDRPAVDEPIETIYALDVKATQAPICVFGSYCLKNEDKLKAPTVWLEGLGVELIQDFVEEKL